MLRALVAVCIVLAVAGMVAFSGPAGAQAHGFSVIQDSAAQNRATFTVKDFDRTTFRINVSENGSARWTFIYRRSLVTDAEKARFGAFADKFNTQQTELYTKFKERARDLTAAGTAETGRQMNASNFTRRAYVNNLGNQGIVKMSFRWSNFATVNGDTLVIGDLFEGGLYIGPNQRLEVTWNKNLTYVTAEPRPDQRSDDTVTWIGGKNGHQFADERPKVTFKRSSDGLGAPGDSGTSSGGLSIQMWLVGFLGLALVLIFGAVVAYQSGVFGFGTTTADSEVGPESVEAGPSTPVITDEELMTDEDRVLSLLYDNGSRMKQVDIVDETGWSKSKVSMLLSEMDEEDLISKLRVGRENIISISGDEPEAARSPFENDKRDDN